MTLRPPGSTRPDTLLPYSPIGRSGRAAPKVEFGKAGSRDWGLGIRKGGVASASRADAAVHFRLPRSRFSESRIPNPQSRPSNELLRTPGHGTTHLDTAGAAVRAGGGRDSGTGRQGGRLEECRGGKEWFRKGKIRG